MKKKTVKPFSVVDFRRKSANYLESRKKKLYSLVGSPDYMAVELLLGEGYDFSVDWWSIGIIAFELVVGIPPFFGESPMEVFHKIKNLQQSLKELDELINAQAIEMSEVCWNFITSLLCEPNRRIGQSGGAEEILRHKFFSDLDLKHLRQTTPPFVPDLSSDIDLKYFGDRDLGEGSFEDFKAEAENNITSLEDPVPIETVPFGKGPLSPKVPGFTFKRKDSGQGRRRRGSVVDVDFNPNVSEPTSPIIEIKSNVH